MKKLLIILGGAMLVVSGCFGGGAVSSMSFDVNAGDGIRRTLEIIPDYEGRTLDLQLSFGESDSAKGVVGDEFFERFESGVELVRDGDGEMVDDVGATFKVILVNSDGSSVRIAVDYGELGEFEPLLGLYEDLQELLTANVPL